MIDWHTLPIETEDERFMCEALKEAVRAYRAKEVPVGAVVVHQGQIIARGYNQVESLKDATAHAEVLAIGSASQVLNNWRLEGATLYCTLEPCLMCAGAMLLARVDRLVWGAPDIRHGANGSLIDVIESIKHPTHELKVERGVLGEVSADLMRRFFQERRNGSHQFD